MPDQVAASCTAPRQACTALFRRRGWTYHSVLPLRTECIFRCQSARVLATCIIALCQEMGWAYRVQLARSRWAGRQAGWRGAAHLEQGSLNGLYLALLALQGAVSHLQQAVQAGQQPLGCLPGRAGRRICCQWPAGACTSNLLQQAASACTGTGIHASCKHTCSWCLSARALAFAQQAHLRLSSAPAASSGSRLRIWAGRLPLRCRSEGLPGCRGMSSPAAAAARAVASCWVRLSRRRW